MKRTALFLLLLSALCFTGCFEKTQEVTINADGSGSVTTKFDMSALLGLAKMAGQGKEMDELKDKKMDTLISLAPLMDSMSNLSNDEKAIFKKGTMQLQFNLEEEKFLTSTVVPFKNPSQLGSVNSLSSKILEKGIAKAMAEKSGAGDKAEQEKMPSGSYDDFYVTTYGKSVIERKLDKDKYAKVDEDQGMQALKQMSGMGLAAKSTFIYNFAKPIKKAEGKNVTVSDDKKKVTISSDSDSFFDDGTALEFKIEY